MQHVNSVVRAVMGSDQLESMSQEQLSATILSVCRQLAGAVQDQRVEQRRSDMPQPAGEVQSVGEAQSVVSHRVVSKSSSAAVAKPSREPLKSIPVNLQDAIKDKKSHLDSALTSARAQKWMKPQEKADMKSAIEARMGYMR